MQKGDAASWPEAETHRDSPGREQSCPPTAHPLSIVSSKRSFKSLLLQEQKSAPEDTGRRLSDMLLSTSVKRTNALTHFFQ